MMQCSVCGGIMIENTENSLICLDYGFMLMEGE